MSAIDALAYVLAYLSHSGESLSPGPLRDAVLALESLRDALIDIYGVVD